MPVPDMRIDSEGAKSPTTRSCPSTVATTRLCMAPLNSTRMFLPSTRTAPAANTRAAISVSSAIVGLWAGFINLVLYLSVLYFSVLYLPGEFSPRKQRTDVNYGFLQFIV